ncbi:MAG: SpoIIIAH-like family protein [Lachnospiraceae bacterium]|nr:SpoIIIAH-like family protein [Lachnospiraceae bacterium]
MKRIFRKNQLVVTALALLIAVAGYFNYTYDADENEIATMAEKSNQKTKETKDTKGKTTAQADESMGDESAGETVLTESDSIAISKAASLKMDREQTRAAGKATLLEVVNNKELTEQERKSAVDELAKMTDIAEREAACEMMLQSKGFEEAIVSISGEGADVIVNKKEVTDAERAQIEDVIHRKGGVAPDHIVISAMN